MFRIKPHIHQSLSEGSKKPLCAPGPRDSTETESDLPVTVCMSPAEARVSSGHRSAVGMGQQWAQVSSGHGGDRGCGCTQWISNSWDPTKGLRNPREFDFGGQCDLIAELTQDWGNRLLEGTNKTLYAPESGRK